MVDREKALKQIKLKLPRAGIDALLVSDKSNITYLTGFYSTGSLVLITKKGMPAYFIDRMNRTLADKMLRGMDLRTVTAKSPIEKSLAGFIREIKAKRLGYDSEDISAASYERLSDLLPGIKLVAKVNRLPVCDIVRDMRKIKKTAEIKTIRKAAKDTVRIWNEVRKDLKTGMTEQEIASMINVAIHRKGYSNSFTPIVAIGENTAYPHALAMGRRLKKREHLLVDFGIRLGGYCSDLTRIWAGGRIVRKIEELKKHVLEAHDRAIKRIKPGVRISSLVKDSNTYFISNNLGAYILHGLGHGIGLDVHEAPFLRENSGQKLKEGMVITIEPGLYIPGLGGIRIEDMVLVTKNGYEVLTR